MKNKLRGYLLRFALKYKNSDIDVSVIDDIFGVFIGYTISTMFFSTNPTPEFVISVPISGLISFFLIAIIVILANMSKHFFVEATLYGMAFFFLIDIILVIMSLLDISVSFINIKLIATIVTGGLFWITIRSIIFRTILSLQNMLN